MNQYIVIDLTRQAHMALSKPEAITLAEHFTGGVADLTQAGKKMGKKMVGNWLESKAAISFNYYGNNGKAMIYPVAAKN